MTQSGRRERTKNWVNKSNKIYWDESFKIILLTKGKERIKHAFTSRSSEVTFIGRCHKFKMVGSGFTKWLPIAELIKELLKRHVAL